MQVRVLAVLLALLSSLVAGCKEPDPASQGDAAVADPTDAAVETPDAAVTAPDASVPDPVLDAGPSDGGNKAAACASTFGNVLTNAFGRVDATVVAVVQPKDTQCALPNNDHLVVQVLMDGAVYRMVVNILSASSDPNVRFATAQAALPAPAWAEGWHPSLTMDYVTVLGRHQGDFTPYSMGALSQHVTDLLTLGAPISVYATSGGGTNAASTHLVHRNGNLNDGALVLDPTGANPTWLLFSFSNQSF